MTRPRALLAAVPQRVWAAVTGLVLLASLGVAVVVGAGLQVWRGAVAPAVPSPAAIPPHPPSGLVVVPGTPPRPRAPAPGPSTVTVPAQPVSPVVVPPAAAPPVTFPVAVTPVVPPAVAPPVATPPVVTPPVVTPPAGEGSGGPVVRPRVQGGDGDTSQRSTIVLRLTSLTPETRRLLAVLAPFVTIVDENTHAGDGEGGLPTTDVVIEVSGSGAAHPDQVARRIARVVRALQQSAHTSPGTAEHRGTPAAARHETARRAATAAAHVARHAAARDEAKARADRAHHDAPAQGRHRAQGEHHGARSGDHHAHKARHAARHAGHHHGH